MVRLLVSLHSDSVQLKKKAIYVDFRIDSQWTAASQREKLHLLQQDIGNALTGSVLELMKQKAQ